jgi:hypothetical protein
LDIEFGIGVWVLLTAESAMNADQALTSDRENRSLFRTSDPSRVVEMVRAVLWL